MDFALRGSLVVTSIRVHPEGATLTADFRPSREFCPPCLRGWCYEWTEPGKIEMLLHPRIFYGFFLDGSLPYFGEAIGMFAAEFGPPSAIGNSAPTGSSQTRSSTTAPSWARWRGGARTSSTSRTGTPRCTRRSPRWSRLNKRLLENAWDGGRGREGGGGLGRRARHCGPRAAAAGPHCSCYPAPRGWAAPDRHRDRRFLAGRDPALWLDVANRRLADFCASFSASHMSMVFVVVCPGGVRELPGIIGSNAETVVHIVAPSRAVVCDRLRPGEHPPCTFKSTPGQAFGSAWKHSSWGLRAAFPPIRMLVPDVLAKIAEHLATGPTVTPADVWACFGDSDDDIY